MTKPSMNRDRLLEGEVAAAFLARLLDRPEVRRLMSSEHFSVDGTLIEAPPRSPDRGPFGIGSAGLLPADGPA